MGRYVRFSITVREDQYKKLRLVENRSQLLRNLIDVHFGVKAEESLEARLASVETKLNAVLEHFVTPPAGKDAKPVAA